MKIMHFFTERDKMARQHDTRPQVFTKSHWNVQRARRCKSTDIGDEQQQQHAAFARVCGRAHMHNTTVHVAIARTCKSETGEGHVGAARKGRSRLRHFGGVAVIAAVKSLRQPMRVSGAHGSIRARKRNRHAGERTILQGKSHVCSVPEILLRLRRQEPAAHRSCYV